MSSESKSVRFFSDEELLRACRVERIRSSGPGGQKRNKTSNAIRLHYEPLDVTSQGNESRSAAENQLRALRRLRVKIAATHREPVAERFDPPDWFLELRKGDRLDVSHRSLFHAATAGLMLDLLDAFGGSPKDVGSLLGVSTTSVVKLLESEDAT